ncbi:MAG: ATP-binding cassette domain-containing protein [Thermodesulfobacteriota bacterium]|nr:ATP-binding cassette domain-containing protein [Thermodesulfobacteriota bacterium]
MGESALVIEKQTTPLVRVQGFQKRYRKQIAVDGLDLAIQPGEIYGLIGPDGAGKSSLMKAIAGVLSFENGKVEVFDVALDSEAAAEQIKGRLGFMPQGLGLNLYAELSVDENIDFFAQLRLVPPKLLAERKHKLLAMTRLEGFHDRPVKQLSGGMKQKLGLVCTLIHEPELVILDEPTTGVDPVSRRDFWAILTELLREQGITALVSTAYMDEAARFHRLTLMYEGQVLAEGEPDAISQLVPGCLVKTIVEPQVEALYIIKLHYDQVEAVGSHLRIFVPEQSPDLAIEQITALFAELRVTEIHASKASLEDAFISLLRQRKLAEDETGTAVISHPSEDSPFKDGIAITATGLTKDFGAFRAVNQVNFQVKQGEIFGLLGANGAGKTTVIKMLTGILPPTAGGGMVAGADMHQATQTIREHIGYVSQAFSLYRDLTVMENIRLYARVYAVPKTRFKQRIDWVVQRAGLHGVTSRLAGSLPMGIRQRLALGCALIHKPQVLFLDEPTSGVDPIGRRRFWDILVHLARIERVAILVTTHYMSEAEHCDHLALMYDGKIIADTSPEAMKQRLQQEAGQLLEIDTDHPLQVLSLLERAGFEGVSLFGKHIHLLTKDPLQAERNIRDLLAGRNIQLIDLRPCVPTLEDVFVYQIMAQEKQECSS